MSFSLEDCFLFGFSVVKIHSLKLKELNLGFIRCSRSLEIDCPNLTSLVMNYYYAEEIHFKDISSLVEARVYFSPRHFKLWRMVVNSVSHVKHLATGWNLEFKFLLPKDQLLFDSPLCNVKQLEIQTGYSKVKVLAMASLLQFLPNLEALILEPPLVIGKKKYYCDFSREPEWEESERMAALEQPIHLQLPSLKFVKIKDFKQTMEEAIFISYLILHGDVLEKIILVHPLVEGNFAAQSVVLRRRRINQLRESCPI
ncbi:hypothetical protein Tsubulata_048296 [Turnera subulata]|uniref:FBD domain-containing protein n=1 Tax=Turnera subulata TaxID=218843 RepID=A0A9Q0FTV6_9ROSI|nr:hypothetical protein Tsubulata_048296 [Turnera subulata]